MGIIGFIGGSILPAITAHSIFGTGYIAGTLLPFVVAHPIVGIPTAIGAAVVAIFI